jgi:DNA topoisomerase-3
MNLSRLFTCSGGRPATTGVLSVGRVQTPTLKLVVDRDREIARFVSVPFWAIDVSLSACGQSFTAQLDAARRQHRRRRPLPAAAGRAAGRGAIRAAAVPRWCRSRPSACAKARRCRSTWAPCRKCVPSSLGLDVQETLDIAQALYETHKATTYPRSDSGYLPESMLAEVPTGPRQPAQDRSQPAALDRPARPHPALARLERRQGDGAPRHHPDAGTRQPVGHEREGTGRLPADPRALPRAVPPAPRVRPHGGAALLRRAVAGGYVGKQIAVAGWRQVLATPEAATMRMARMRSAARCCRAASGMACQVGQVDLKALKTLPPKPYTQGELVKAMKGVAKFRDRPAPEAEAQGDDGHRHRGDARQHHQRPARPRLPA